MVLGRAQIQALVRTNAPELATNTWAGADRVRLLRRVQALNESELKTMLQATLQKEYVRERGELELRFSRAWLPINVPDEPLELKVLDMPLAGVTANFIVRFELRTGKEVVGNWQVVAQARIWQELWVAAGPLKRGQLLGAHDLTRERRDVLAARDALIDLPAEERQLEMTENLPAGAPLTLRSVRARQLVHRGDVIEALAQDGLMTISLRVEALEPGAQGQVIRVRNPVSKREFRGKVQNEQTVMVSI
jgi:flagella basal body P-ring formation protein FlgA